MLRNYFKVALRNIRKHKFFSAINIVGLAIGLTTCLLVGLYISDELSYDRFHRDAESIYRIGLNGRLAGQEIHSTTSSTALAETLVSEVPGVDAAVRVWQRRNTVFKYEEKSFMEQNVFMVDSNFFEFFTFELLDGDAKQVLLEPNTVVLTEATARKYFGNEPAVGKLMTVGNDNKTYKVTGICAETPHNSHFRFDAVLAGSHDEFFKTLAWTNNSLYTYYRKNANARVEDID
jgi:putative ABC transport system permease protein